jgi:hypothetical protein
MYKTLYRKSKIDLHELHYRLGVHSGVPEGYAVPVQQGAPVILLLLQTRC